MYDNYKCVEIDYDEIKNLNLENEEPVYLIVRKGYVKFEFIVRVKKDSDRGIIFSSGAYNYNKISLPVFQRYTWMNEFQENLIYFNDPTLYLGKINLGWGYGTEEEFFLENIGDIIQKLLVIMKVYNNKTVLYLQEVLRECL